MIICSIIVVIAFCWLLYETDYLRVRLSIGEALESNSEGIKPSLSSKVSCPDVPFKPSQFTALDMPATSGNLNIMCKRC